MNPRVDTRPSKRRDAFIVGLAFCIGALILALPLAGVIQSLREALNYSANIEEYGRIAALRADESYFKASLAGVFCVIVFLALTAGGVVVAWWRKTPVLTTIAFAVAALVLIAVPVAWRMTIL